MKKTISTLLALVMVFALFVPASAAGTPVGTLPSAATRQAVTQSLDFGAYPVDFPGGAIIDNMRYTEGDTFNEVGDHTVYYTEKGVQYKSPLYLYKIGDLNCDNTCNVLDLVVMKKKLAGKRTLSNAGTKAADVNLNGVINSTDTVRLKQSILLSDDLPVTGYSSANMEKLVDFTVEVESGRDVRVLQLTDPQIIEKEQMHPGREGVADRWSKKYKDEEYRNYCRKVITEYDPDFIFITGDVVYGEFDDSGESLLEFISFMDSFKIPWAPVFGNHDQESAKGADWQCKQFAYNSKYCLFRQRNLTGNGNYTVGIKQDGVYKRVFFMLDSNGCGSAHANSLANGHTKTSAGFGDDQISWYTDLATKMRYAEPNVQLSAAFHIQFAAFADAYAKYGFTGTGTQENPVNIDAIEDAAETDFGFLGRDLKGPWDNDRKVFYGMKALGFDSFFVGHEHCNSASVLYRGIRFQYGLKSSTYDRANYLNFDGTVVGTYSKPENPIVGGTAVPLNNDGTIGQPYCVYYGASSAPLPPEPIPEPIGTDVYDFNGTDFDFAYENTGVCATGFICSKVSGAPAGYTGDVYGRSNYSSSGMATIAVDFKKPIDVTKIASMKLRMYVPTHSLTSGKQALFRLFSSEIYDSLQFEGTFTAVGGAYDEWVEIDLLPLMRTRMNAAYPAIIQNDTLQKFFMTYRFYSPDTTAKCYYDSIIIDYLDENYFAGETTVGRDVYDFNGVDFSTAYRDTGVTASGFVCSKMADPTKAPAGYTGDVYARNNSSSSGMATVAVDFGHTLDLSKVSALKLRMYVPSHAITSGKKALFRIFSDEVYDSIQFEGSFTTVGGVYDNWVEIDLLPLLRSRTGAGSWANMIAANTLPRFLVTYRFYSADTTAMCYYDSITVEYTDSNYWVD
ncbi:MAG: dockerin type I domain-containing protein [Clostridia bacterium]|nr:dockerin type I domain-containing protein [Clostridia bacterium]